MNKTNAFRHSQRGYVVELAELIAVRPQWTKAGSVADKAFSGRFRAGTRPNPGLDCVGTWIVEEDDS